MNFSTERENNIIKNIAKEIVIECAQIGMVVSQDLADCLVKLKLLNPKNGFTASEVMPRSLTQQLVRLIVDDLKQDTPAMNCIKMQVYWESIKMNVSDLKKEYFNMCNEKTDPYLSEILTLDREDATKMVRILANFILAAHNLGSLTHLTDLKEVVAGIQSVFKYREDATYQAFHNLNNDMKADKIRYLGKLVSGIRLYLKHMGKASEGVQEVDDLPSRTETLKKEVSMYNAKLTAKIEDIRDVISSVVPMEYFISDVTDIIPHVENLPPECDDNDLIYLKKVLAIMLQHQIYLSDVMSKLEEIDGDANFFLREFNDTLQKLQGTIRDRDAVPTTEVYDEFVKASEMWMEIQSYMYCLETVEEIVVHLENINKKEHFAQTKLEKAMNRVTEKNSGSTSKIQFSKPSPAPPRQSQDVSGSLNLKESEDFHIEFNGYCAWTLYFVEGMLIPGDPKHGLFQFQDQYYSFSSKPAHELWARDPQNCLLEIYEYLRNNPELVFLLNVYDTLYSTKNLQMVKKVDRKSITRREEVQTVLHPIEEYWDKDYAFSLWELRKRALLMSRIVKFATKSVQTTIPHTHFRSSIGVLAAPDKDKETQTKKDSSCNHPAIATYLYGLRGQKEDKFRVIELTRPIDEGFEREIILEEKDKCRERQERKMFEKPPYSGPPGSTQSGASEDHCDDFEDRHFINKTGEQYC